MRKLRRAGPVPPASDFTGFRFGPEVIALAVRWYLRFGLSYRDVEELPAERGIEVDHVTIDRWVQRFTPLLVDAAHLIRHAVGTAGSPTRPSQVAGQGRYVHRAIDEFGQVIDIYVSATRDAVAARRFFQHALESPKGSIGSAGCFGRLGVGSGWRVSTLGL
jgi:transposase, IS6 family